MRALYDAASARDGGRNRPGSQAPFSTCICGHASAGHYFRNEVSDLWREKMPWREITLSVDYRSPEFGYYSVCCGSIEADLGVFRAALPQTARWAFVQAREGVKKGSSSFEWAPMPLLAPDMPELLVDRDRGDDGRSRAYAKTKGFDLSVPLGPALSQAVAAMLSMLPVGDLFRHALADPSVSAVSSMRFTCSRRSVDPVMSLLNILHLIVFKRLQAEMRTPHQTAPESTKIVDELLALHPFATQRLQEGASVINGSEERAARGEQLVITVCRAFVRLGDWDRMGTNIWRLWCCPCLGSSTKSRAVSANLQRLYDASPVASQRLRVQQQSEFGLEPGIGFGYTDQSEGEGTAELVLRQVKSPTTRGAHPYLPYEALLSRERQQDQARLQERQWRATAERAQLFEQGSRTHFANVKAEEAGNALHRAAHGQRFAAEVFRRVLDMEADERKDQSASAQPALPLHHFAVLPPRAPQVAAQQLQAALSASASADMPLGAAAAAATAAAAKCV